ncbi:hypothetical protein [Aquihabitans sp. McL0605]|uniref:hypothetical protein n=1 Tax=Aquihabitans sp. McL0605 TaxID=3415671 RepID=UPI003CF88ACE
MASSATIERGTAAGHRVDEAAARQVAAAFLEAVSAPEDLRVRAAYAQLSRQADSWFARLTAPAVGDAVRVVFTRLDEPYADSSELLESVRSHRVLELVSVAHDKERRHPLLDGMVGGSHDRFRAVHDIVSHGWLGHDFSRDGEYSAWLAEDRIYRGVARWVLGTELHAHHSVRWTTGSIAPFKAVLLPPNLLRASMDAGHPVAL